MLNVRALGLAAAVGGALVLSTTVSRAENYILGLDINSLSADVDNAVVVIENSNTASVTYWPTNSSLSIDATGSIAVNTLLPGPASANSVMVMGVTTEDSDAHLALFTNTSFGGNGSAFSAQEAALISALQSNDRDGLNSFVGTYMASLGFTPGGDFKIFEFSVSNEIGDGTSSFTLATTPLPPAWTMMLIGFAGIGVIAFRRQKHGSSLVTA